MKMYVNRLVMRWFMVVIAAMALTACSGQGNDVGDSNSASQSGGAVQEKSTTQSGANTQTEGVMQVEKFLEGKHYAVTKEPLPVEAGKIAVTEFFWYGCPHCQHFEPMLSDWAKKQSSDVILTFSPAIWSEPMVLHAKLFFIARGLERFAELHHRLFTETIAMHGEQNLEAQVKHFAGVFAEYGMKEEEFKRQLDSPEIVEKVEAAQKVQEASGLTGTPSMVVDGKFLVLTRNVTSLEQLLEVTDFLIVKERQSRQP